MFHCVAQDSVDIPPKNTQQSDTVGVDASQVPVLGSSTVKASLVYRFDSPLANHINVLATDEHDALPVAGFGQAVWYIHPASILLALSERKGSCVWIWKFIPDRDDGNLFSLETKLDCGESSVSFSPFLLSFFLSFYFLY